MRYRMLFVLALATVAAPARAAEPAKKADAANEPVGTWQLIREGDAAPKATVTYTFAADGKLRVNLPAQFFDATYELAGSTLTVTFRGSERIDRFTVRNLTPGSMTLLDMQNRIELEFKKR
jgi:uncharacterized protein (TIGR03066 family)